MTDDTVDSDAYAEVLAAHPLTRDADERQRVQRRWLAGAAVVLVHVFAIMLIVFSNQIPVVQRIRETIPEAILWIPTQKPAPPQKKIDEEQPFESFPFLSAPITLPPEPKKALPPPPSGGLEGVGRSLACGASSYEYLSPAQRETCLRHPWAFIKRPDGTIVLDAPKPAPPPAFTASDLARHEQQTGPPCPLLANVPCLSKILPNHDPVTNGSQ